MSNFIAGQEWIWIMILVIALAIVGVIAAIVYVIKTVSKKIPTADKKRLDILKDRLARGEITQEEYEKLKKEFEGS
jgi:putative membrane protein